MTTPLDEEWRPVVGYEGYYEVSNCGRVRSLDRVITTRSNRKISLRGRMLRPANDRGYRFVSLNKDGQRQNNVLVCRLVLQSFVGPRPDGAHCLHYDDDKNNDSVTNLRYGTSSENAKDRVRNGLHNSARKTHCKHGHEFNAKNTYRLPSGGRQCRVCKAADQRRRMRERRAAAKVARGKAGAGDE